MKTRKKTLKKTLRKSEISINQLEIERKNFLKDLNYTKPSINS